MATPRYSIVVPVYNEQEVLPELCRRLREAVARLHGPTEIVFVDDGSADGSRGILKAAVRGQGHPHRRPGSRNFGHQAAISAGFSHAEGDAVAVLDGDLQDPPELLPSSSRSSARDGTSSMACASDGRRRDRKRLAYFVFYRLLHRLANIEIPLDSGDFCVMSRRVVDHLNGLPETDRFVRGLRAWIGFRQTGIPYERDRRRAGNPKYTLLKLVQLSLDGLLSFSYTPLRLLEAVGFVLSAVSFIGILIVLFRYLFTPYVPGYTSLAVLVLFFGGVQLLTAGCSASTSAGSRSR